MRNHARKIPLLHPLDRIAKDITLTARPTSYFQIPSNRTISSYKRGDYVLKRTHSAAFQHVIIPNGQYQATFTILRSLVHAQQPITAETSFTSTKKTLDSTTTCLLGPGPCSQQHCLIIFCTDAYTTMYSNYIPVRLTHARPFSSFALTRSHECNFSAPLAVSPVVLPCSASVCYVPYLFSNPQLFRDVSLSCYLPPPP